MAPTHLQNLVLLFRVAHFAAGMTAGNSIRDDQLGAISFGDPVNDRQKKRKDPGFTAGMPIGVIDELGKPALPPFLQHLLNRLRFFLGWKDKAEMDFVAGKQSRSD